MNETASRELMIPKQMDELQIALESLGKSIESLSMRLNRVSTQAGPQVESNSKAPIYPCDFAESLAEKSRLARRLRELVESMESRLEL